MIQRIGAARTLLGSITRSHLGDLPVGHHRWVIFSVAYLVVRRLLGCLMVLARREASRDAELLALRHENTVLCRQIGWVRYQPDDRLWLSALSRQKPRTLVGGGVRGDPGDAARLAPAPDHAQMGLHQLAASRTAVHGSRDPQACDPHRDRQPDVGGIGACNIPVTIAYAGGESHSQMEGFQAEDRHNPLPHIGPFATALN